MLFNVEVPLAQQLLWGTAIENALSERNTERLQLLSSIHPDGFWAVFDNLPFDEWAQAEPIKFASACYCTGKSDLLVNTPITVKLSIIHALRSSVLSLSSWKKFTQSIAEGISGILYLDNSERIVKKLYDTIMGIPIKVTYSSNKNILDAESVNSLEKTASSYTDGVITLLREIKKNGGSDVYSQRCIQIDTEPIGYIEICAEVYKQDPNKEFWVAFSSKFQPEDIFKELTYLIEKNLYSGRHNGAIQVLIDREQNITWENFVSNIDNRLKRVDLYPVVEFIECLWMLRKVDPSVDNRFKNLIREQGYILSHLATAQDKSDYDALAWCVFIIFKYAPDLPDISGENRARQGYKYLTRLIQISSNQLEVIDRFVNIIIENNQLEWLLELHRTNNRLQAWACACLKQIISFDVDNLLFTPDLVVKKWAQIKELIKDDSQKLIEKLNFELGLSEYLVQGDFSYELSGLYDEIICCKETGIDENFLNWMQQGLKNISKEVWISELSKEGHLPQLVIDLLAHGYTVNMDIAFLDGLVEHGIAVMRGQTKPVRLIDQWKILPLALDTKNLRPMLGKRLLDAAKKEDKIAPVFFDLYKDEITQPNLLKKDREVVYKLFSPLLTSRNEKGLEWLAETLEKYPQLLIKYKPGDTLEEFKSRLKNADVTGKDRVNEFIRRIAKILC